MKINLKKKKIEENYINLTLEQRLLGMSSVSSGFENSSLENFLLICEKIIFFSINYYYLKEIINITKNIINKNLKKKQN